MKVKLHFPHARETHQKTITAHKKYFAFTPTHPPDAPRTPSGADARVVETEFPETEFPETEFPDLTTERGEGPGFMPRTVEAKGRGEVVEVKLGGREHARAHARIPGTNPESTQVY